MPKLKKKVVVFIILLLMGITNVTYSRFMSLGNVNTNANIAAWTVKVNGQSVSSSSSFTLDNIVWSENEKVANGYVAPGGNGYYEIKIDTTGTKVAVDYTIGFNPTVLEEHTRMKVDKITVDDTPVTLSDGYYDGFISLKDVLDDKIITIKIYIIWDDANNDEGDYLDLQSALDYGNIELPIVVAVRQHIENSDLNATLLPQLLPYKETLLEVERPTTGITINPYYESSLDSLYQNPERGMYSSNFLVLSKSGNQIKDMEAHVSKLLYLKVDLSAFSAWRNGTDIELTSDAINTLKNQLENIKQHNNTVILRFVYDNNATGIVDGVNKFEPEQITLLRHIEQLKSVFEQYATTIYTIQVGFYGLWGESFYNTDVNSHPEYYIQTMEALLDATEYTEIMIAFRTPSYAKYAIQNSNYDSSRVGIFNDALLSQNDDMGTFTNRREDLEWLNTRNVSYGGEALPATFTDTLESTNAYNDVYNNVGGLNSYLNLIKTKTNNWDLIKFTEDEMFKSHLSYINFEWNQYKHYIWANQTYNGKDELYQRKTALEYIQSHLGYRFVLKNVVLPRSANSLEKINASIQIENVGFGSVLKSKNATLVFVDANNIVKGEVDITSLFDIKDFKSQSSIKKDVSVDLPDLSSGTYKVFLRLSNNEKLNDESYYSAIRFANNSIWDNSLQANRIGNIKIN